MTNSLALPLVAASGALSAAGLALGVAALRGVRLNPPRRGWPAGRRLTRRRSTHLLAALAVGALAGLVTGWPVAAVAGAAATLGAPALLSGRKRRQAIARLEGLEQWSRHLADTLTGAAGIEEAITASAEHAPEAIRPQVQALSRRLRLRVSTEEALRLFADELDDGAADMVAAALILTARARGRGLAEVLTALARTVAKEVAMRREIDAERATHRTTARWVAAMLAGYTAFALLNRDYMTPFDSPAGQLVLAFAAALYGAAFGWLHHLAVPEPGYRFLPAATHPRARRRPT